MLDSCRNARGVPRVASVFERHRATLDRALTAIAERGYWSAVSRIGEPQGLRRRRGRGRQGRLRRAARQAVSRSSSPATVGTVGGERSPYGFPLGITYPKADVDALFAAVARAAEPLAQGGARGVGRRVPRDPAPDQPAELPHRQRRDAHDRPGVHDGVPGRRPARAGPRPRGGRVRVGRDAAHPGEGAVGKAAGQERAAADGKALPHRAARHRARDRLLHVPDVERLSRPVRRSRHRQRGRREAASGGDPAARDHGEDRARGAGRGGLRSERRHAGRARGRRRHRAEARAAPRREADRLHRQHGQRRLARGERAAGAGLHRKGRRQPDRRRLGRRLQGHGAQRRVLAVALHRADVHGAAEHLHPARRHRHRRGPPVVRPGRRGAGRRRAASCSAIRRARSRSWARW